MKYYLGSCADDSIGIGTMIIGTDYRRATGDYPFEVYYQPSDVWIECYDVVTVTLDSETEKTLMHVAG